jgi:protein-tyrosine-phosphatase
MIEATEKRNITPEQAVKVLRKNGIEATEEEAKKILDFLYLLAKLTVNQYFNGK